jgi:hypothetical protein
MIVPMRYGGVVRRRVLMLSLPRPAMTLQDVNIDSQKRGMTTYLGKNVVTAPAEVQPYIRPSNSQVFGSLLSANGQFIH